MFIPTGRLVAAAQITGGVDYPQICGTLKLYQSNPEGVVQDNQLNRGTLAEIAVCGLPADHDGSVVRGKLTLTPKWFDDYYKFNPALTGDKFGDKPVMVYYNTKDTVVEPKTILDCAHAYSNVSIYEFTTDDGHGYEMSYEHSAIKDEIMNRVVTFFTENL